MKREARTKWSTTKTSIVATIGLALIVGLAAVALTLSRSTVPYIEETRTTVTTRPVTNSENATWQPFNMRIGVNDDTLLVRFLDPSLYQLRENGIESLTHAASKGIRFIRFQANLFSPLNFKRYYIEQPGRFWKAYDELVGTARRFGIGLVPFFYANLNLTSGYLGVSCRENFRIGSEPNLLLKKFIKELITRYMDNPVILFWELTNELNLYADLGSGCSPTTDEMITFLRDLATFVKNIDVRHSISAGHSIPRKGAEHLRDCQKRLGNIPSQDLPVSCWATDSLSEFQRNIKDINPDPIDIISVHLYNQDCHSYYRECETERFDVTGKFSANLLNIIKNITDRLGRRLFVGEFGDSDPWIQGSLAGKPEDKTAPFSQNVLEKIVELGIPYAAIWEWYAPHIWQDRVIWRIAPGETDFIISKIQEANAKPSPPVSTSLRALRQHDTMLMVPSRSTKSGSLMLASLGRYELKEVYSAPHPRKDG